MRRKLTLAILGYCSYNTRSASPTTWTTKVDNTLPSNPLWFEQNLGSWLHIPQSYRGVLGIRNDTNFCNSSEGAAGDWLCPLGFQGRGWSLLACQGLFDSWRVSVMPREYCRLLTEERIGIKPSKVLNDISGVAVPMRHASVCLDSVHQCTPSILHSQCYNNPD